MFLKLHKFSSLIKFLKFFVQGNMMFFFQRHKSLWGKKRLKMAENVRGKKHIDQAQDGLMRLSKQGYDLF